MELNTVLISLETYDDLNARIVQLNQALKEAEAEINNIHKVLLNNRDASGAIFILNKDADALLGICDESI